MPDNTTSGQSEHNKPTKTGTEKKDARAFKRAPRPAALAKKAAKAVARADHNERKAKYEDELQPKDSGLAKMTSRFRGVVAKVAEEKRAKKKRQEEY